MPNPKARIHIFGKEEEWRAALAEVIDTHQLPIEYGGQAPALADTPFLPAVHQALDQNAIKVGGRRVEDFLATMPATADALPFSCISVSRAGARYNCGAGHYCRCCGKNNGHIDANGSANHGRSDGGLNEADVSNGESRLISNGRKKAADGKDNNDHDARRGRNSETFATAAAAQAERKQRGSPCPPQGGVCHGTNGGGGVDNGNVSLGDGEGKGVDVLVAVTSEAAAISTAAAAEGRNSSTRGNSNPRGGGESAGARGTHGGDLAWVLDTVPGARVVEGGVKWVLDVVPGARVAAVAAEAAAGAALGAASGAADVAGGYVDAVISEDTREAAVTAWNVTSFFAGWGV